MDELREDTLVKVKHNSIRLFHGFRKGNFEVTMSSNRFCDIASKSMLGGELGRLEVSHIIWIVEHVFNNSFAFMCASWKTRENNALQHDAVWITVECVANRHKFSRSRAKEKTWSGRESNGAQNRCYTMFTAVKETLVLGVIGAG